jgi:hypothetical protein
VQVASKGKYRARGPACQDFCIFPRRDRSTGGGHEQLCRADTKGHSRGDPDDAAAYTGRQPRPGASRYSHPGGENWLSPTPSGTSRKPGTPGSPRSLPKSSSATAE